MGSDDRVALAAAFVYGFPLVFDLQQVDRFTRSGIGGVSGCPPRPATSVPSCACTSRMTPCSTGATNSRRPSGATDQRVATARPPERRA
jgi:hypothetical protein